MHIAFASKQLRTICEDEAVATGILGEADAETLRKRLADLRAASSMTDLLVGNARLDDDQRLLIDIGQTRRIVLAASHVKNPKKQDGALVWSKITRVKLVEITDL